MNKERLTILRDALLSIGEDRKFQGAMHFDYNTWAERNSAGLAFGECGTSGCVLGLCPLLFPNQLKVEWSSPLNSSSCYGNIRLVGFSATDNLDVACEFFDLDWQDASDIFSGRYFDEEGNRLLMSQTTPKMVADRITEYLQRP